MEHTNQNNASSHAQPIEPWNRSPKKLHNLSNLVPYADGPRGDTLRLFANILFYWFQCLVQQVASPGASKRAIVTPDLVFEPVVIG